MLKSRSYSLIVRWQNDGAHGCSNLLAEKLKLEDDSLDSARREKLGHLNNQKMGSVSSIDLPED